MAILIGLLVPAVPAIDPLWTEAATTSGELSSVTISTDGSTIVAGGDQLIALSRDGKKLWTGWSGSHLAISRDGKYILTSKDQHVRMISGSGTMLWDVSLEVPVTEVAMKPDASILAAGGGNRIRLIDNAGNGIRQNTSFPFNHLRLFPNENRTVFTTNDGIRTSNYTFYSEWSDTNMSQDLVEVSADGFSYVTVTNNRIRLYTGNGNLQWERALPGGNALSFAYSRDGSTIIVGRDDNTIEVLDRDGARLWTAHASYWVTSVAVSGDGNTIAAGSFDKVLSVYDHAGTLLGSYTTANPIKTGSVAVSSDGSLIAAVDGSAVYGFSRSQFTPAGTVAVTTTEIPVPVVTTAPPATPVTTTNQPAPPPTATPRATALPVLVPGALLLLMISRGLKP